MSKTMTILDSVSELFDSFFKWKPMGDATSLVLILGYIVNILPAIATLLSIIWVCLRIYETDTVQRLLYGKPKPPVDYT